MSRFFDMESPLFTALGRLADFMILNILFLITCIPIFTIGASCTALSYMTLKMVRNEETYIVRGYFKAFKENFRQATIIWLGCLVVILLLVTDFRIVLVMQGSMAKAMKISLGAVILLLFMGYIYIFPVLSKFYNSCLATVKNACIMAIANLPSTLAAFAIDVCVIVLTFYNSYTMVWGILIWILVGFSLVSYLNSKIFVKVFDKYIPESAKEPVDDNFVTGENEVYEMSAFKNLQPQKIENKEEEQ